MRLSSLFVPTLRDDPADAEIASHRLLLRAGIVRQVMAQDRGDHPGGDGCLGSL